MDGVMEIITGRVRRRRWGSAEKLRIVAALAEPGARVCDVAARHDVCQSLVFTWRRQAREGLLSRVAASEFIPVQNRPHRRVGLVLAGNRVHAADRQRSMALANFAPLLSRPRTTFVALQKGAAVSQIGGWFGPAPPLNLGPKLDDFAETAAVLAGLDAVVTVDTSLASLAGALGERAQVLLPFRPDWRWLLGRTMSP